VPTFRKSGSGWRAEVYRRGIRRSSTHPTKAAAIAWAGRVEADILGGARGDIPKRTFGELLIRYAKEVSPGKKGARWESIRIALLGRDALAKVSLRELDTIHVAEWRDRRLQDVSGASVRREWNLLSHACNIAVREWRWLRSNPFAGVRRPKGAQSRNRLASDAELALLAEHADTPTRKRAYAAFLFAVETGMRASEICGLREIVGSVARLEDTKNGTRREVPLSGRALEIWSEFGPFGLIPGTLDANWRGLTKAAAVKDLHFHDSRHMAITRLSSKLNLLQLARMVGIRDLRILNVYYNESAEDIAKRL
jgi:integrase